MVTRTFQRNKAFSWSLNFDATQENGTWYVHVYDSNGVDMHKIQLDQATVKMAKGLVQQIQAWMNTSDTWSGTVVETWKKQLVQHPASEVEEWVQQS